MKRARGSQKKTDGDTGSEMWKKGKKEIREEQRQTMWKRERGEERAREKEMEE